MTVIRLLLTGLGVLLVGLLLSLDPVDASLPEPLVLSARVLPVSA